MTSVAVVPGPPAVTVNVKAWLGPAPSPVTTAVPFNTAAQSEAADQGTTSFGNSTIVQHALFLLLLFHGAAPTWAYLRVPDDPLCEVRRCGELVFLVQRVEQGAIRVFADSGHRRHEEVDE